MTADMPSLPVSTNTAITSDVKCDVCGRYASQHTLAPFVNVAEAGIECLKTETEVLREALTKLQSTVRTLYVHTGTKNKDLLH